MINQIQLERYAEVLLWGLKTARTNRFKKNDLVQIRYHLPAVKLAEILYAKLIGMGMNVVVRADLTPDMELSFYKSSNSRQLTFQTPGDKILYENLNGSIFLHAPESITHLGGVNPSKIGQAAVARKYLRDILTKREEKGDFGWTLCSYPTQEQARHADISIETYSEQIIRACFLNRRDPVGEWIKIYKQAAVIKNRLNRMNVKHFHIESKHIDLEIVPGDMRKWIGISGHNIPSFELFLSPDRRGTRGVYYADQPSYRSGNYVKGVRLTFKDGVAVDIDAEEGKNFVAKQLAMDKGAARLGEFSLTDKRFSKINRFMANTLFDENFGGKFGNCHVAMGSSYSDTYKGNPDALTQKQKEKLGFNDSALHWDLVNTEKKRVTAHLSGGRKVCIYDGGKFTF